MIKTKINEILTPMRDRALTKCRLGVRSTPRVKGWKFDAPHPWGVGRGVILY